MFLLSIIPISLNPDQPNQPGNKIDDIESKIKNLEALLTAENFDWGSSLDFDPSTSKLDRLDPKYYIKDESGNEKIDVKLVLKDLEVARKEDIELRKNLSLTSLDNPLERLKEIEVKLFVGQQRFNDLTNHLTSLIKGEIYDVDPFTAGVQKVSGLTTAQNPAGEYDANVVQRELIRVAAYQQDLLSAKDFWAKIADSHIDTSSKNIKTVTKDEMFYTNTKDGIFGIKRLEELNALIQEHIENSGNSTFLPFSEKIYSLENEIMKVQEDLEIKLNKSKNEKWFPEFKKELQTWQANLLKLKQATTSEIKELENRLNKASNDPNSKEYLNTLGALYKKRTSIEKLNAQIKFIYKVTGNSQATQNITSAFEDKAKEEMEVLLKTKGIAQKEIIKLQQELKSISNNPTMKDEINSLKQAIYKRKALINELNQGVKYLKRLTTKNLTNNAPIQYVKEELIETKRVISYIKKEKEMLETQIKILSNNPKMKDRVIQLQQRLQLMNSVMIQMDFQIKYLSGTVNKYEKNE